MTKPTTGKLSRKLYRCSRCGREELQLTNHWGETYGSCKGCSWKNPMDPFPVWECQEPMPEGFEKPAPWKKVKLGDICEIVEVK